VSGHGGATVDPTVGAYGPIAATADDMALAYSIIAGPDPNDVNSMLQPPPSLKDYNKYQDLSDLTIGIFPNWNKRTDEPAILNSLNDMKEQLGKLGARFVELELEDLNLIKIGKHALHRFG
jgi:Asp-tRNA(Asn)/Glu-tRNA(Gln) amidotransferase A subunit family amidase